MGGEGRGGEGRGGMEYKGKEGCEGSDIATVLIGIQMGECGCILSPF